MGEKRYQTVSRWSGGRVMGIVAGALLSLVALTLLLGGAGLLIANAVLPDEDGFFTSRTVPFGSSGRAVVSRDLAIVSDTPVEIADGGFASVRVRASAVTPREPVFVGIADAGAVRQWLAGAAYDRVDDVHFDPLRVRQVALTGSAVPARPATLDIWVARATGPGSQELRWPVRSGRWSVVVMRPDAAPGVAVRVNVGVRVRHLGAIGIALAGAGLMLAAAAAGLIALVSRGRLEPASTDHAVVADPAGVAGTGPIRIEGVLDPGVGRALWLVKWFLAIPHWIILIFLWIAFWVVTAIAFFAVLFTGRYPRSLFAFGVGVMRWTWRVGFYSYSVLGTDRYPPFTLDDVPDYPARLAIDYPARLSRGLVLVKWILAIPHMIVVAVFTGSWAFGAPGIVGGVDDDWAWWQGSPGLIGILVLFAALALLFSARYPRGIFDLVMGLNRWVYRVWGYMFLLRDEYPPFRLDAGEREPGGDVSEAP